MMDFDSEGFAVDAAGRRIDAARLANLPPALQLQARARTELPVRRRCMQGSIWDRPRPHRTDRDPRGECAHDPPAPVACF